MKCPACGHHTRKGKRNGERRELAEELCALVGFEEDDIWAIQNLPLGIDRLRRIIKKLKGIPVEEQSSIYDTEGNK